MYNIYIKFKGHGKIENKYFTGKRIVVKIFSQHELKTIICQFYKWFVFNPYFFKFIKFQYTMIRFYSIFYIFNDWRNNSFTWMIFTRKNTKVSKFPNDELCDAKHILPSRAGKSYWLHKSWNPSNCPSRLILFNWRTFCRSEQLFSLQISFNIADWL